MRYIFALILFVGMVDLSGQSTLVNFAEEEKAAKWKVMDDGVMGGLSQGNVERAPSGNAVFYGRVSTDNNGGFSSIRCQVKTADVSAFTKMKIRLKGDGKSYQFRLKSDRYDRYSYIYSFQTSGEWETVTIPLGEMYPSFRGMKLRMPNYGMDTIEELAFLIGNKKEESFKIEIEALELEK